MDVFLECFNTTLSSKSFNKMLIDALVVSEHSKIALLYDLSKLGHAHPTQDQEVSKVREVTRLNTFITVLDTADFYYNSDGMKYYYKRKIVELMMKLLEFGNAL